MSRWKRGKSSKHPQSFCSYELLLLKGQQSMCKQDKCNIPPAMLFPPRSAAGVHYSLGVPFLQRWRRLRFAFSSKRWWWLLLLLSSFAPFCMVALESKGILCKATAQFLSCCLCAQNTEKNTLCPLRKHSNQQHSKPQGNSYTCKVKCSIPASR